MQKDELSLRKILAENIRQMRSEIGLSQEKLADECGLHRTYVGSVERAERNVTIGTLCAFSRALKTDVPALLSSKSRKG